MRSTFKRAVVLVVEDDPADQELILRAAKTNAAPLDLRMVNDGEEAMDYLLRQNRFSQTDSAPRPDVILLDLNMPRMDGREFLAKVKSDPELKKLPVIVFTTSDQAGDIARSYTLGCNSYITKPVDPDELSPAIRQLESYWFDLVTLNPR